MATKATKTVGGDPLVTAIDDAWARGNFSAIRALAKRADTVGGAAQAEAQRRLAMVKIDPVVLLAGVVTLFVVLTVAVLTLGH